MRDLAGRPQLAVLIDAENVPAAIADALLVEVARSGDPVIRRAYGDFRQETMRAWSDACPRLGIRAHQVFVRTSGKNAADIALVIDAMDLLHGGGVQGFCLVSSDSDFSHLALRLREQGVAVFGYGERKTPGCFREACGRFTEIEAMMLPPAPSATVTPAPAATAPAPDIAKARRLLRLAFEQCDKSTDRWVNGGQLRSQLGKIDATFSLAEFGHSKFRKFIAWTGDFAFTDAPKPMAVRLMR